MIGRALAAALWTLGTWAGQLSAGYRDGRAAALAEHTDHHSAR